MKTSLKFFSIVFSIIASLNTTAGQPVSNDVIKTMLADDWARAKAYTQDYLNTMPKNEFGFRPTDSVRTFAQQMLHLAQANMFLINTATGKQESLAQGNLEMRASAQSADSVMYYVNKSYDYAIDAVKNIPAENLMQTVSFNMGETITASRLGWILKAFEHQTHHRGQTTIYIRQLDVKPPNERLF